MPTGSLEEETRDNEDKIDQMEGKVVSTNINELQRQKIQNMINNGQGKVVPTNSLASQKAKLENILKI